MSEGNLYVVDLSICPTISSFAPPTCMIFTAGKGQVKIHQSGKVELENCELDEAAKAFWDAVQKYATSR